MKEEQEDPAAQQDSPSQDTLPPGSELGDYRIIRVLGQGGFGVTYLAHDTGLEQDVVVKENLPSQFAGRGGESLTVTSRGGAEGKENFAWATQRFLDEARLLAKLNHPNIVRVLRAFSALGTAYYVMPWVGGKDLKRYAEERKVDQPFLEGVLRRLLPALSYLHGNNLLHRDIKPANILCTDDGTPILIDFGTARALVSERSQTMVESAGYTPMEQLQSHGNVGPWTDLYALGATMYGLITGHCPPRSTDRIGKTDCYVPLAGRAELKDKFSAGFLKGMDKALSVWPEDRWQSADEWMEALNGKSESAPVRHEPKPTSSAVRSAARPAIRPAIRPGSAPKRRARGGALQQPALVFAPATTPESREARPPRKRRHAWAWCLCLLLLAADGVGGWQYYVCNLTPEALYATGLRYAGGDGVPQDPAKAVEYYRRAAEQGLAEAQNNLGRCYWKGEGVEKDLGAAVRWYRKAAEQGLAIAQNSLGISYANGEGVEKDLGTAVQWYRKAAEQGNAGAQYNLGFAYATGQGVVKDVENAAKWYRKAAGQGLAEAQNGLGACYAKGEGVEKDLGTAVQWYRKAADQGLAIAQNGLGACYAKGEGVEKDLGTAVQWYRKAADQGNANAQNNLGVCYYKGEGVVRDLETAAQWYLKAAEQGDAVAQLNLGNMYRGGHGVKKNPYAAVIWYRKAAEQGNAEAQYELGRCSDIGFGVSKNREAAQLWYGAAAQQGLAAAQRRLDEMAQAEKPRTGTRATVANPFEPVNTSTHTGSNTYNVQTTGITPQEGQLQSLPPTGTTIGNQDEGNPAWPTTVPGISTDPRPAQSGFPFR